jgi:acetylornithine deacetylase
VNGEATFSKLGTAHRGVLRIRMIAAGRAAHSSHPDRGESAIDKLIDALVDLRAQPLPEDPVMGKTYYTIGLISGGVAPNVIPAHAEAEAMFRTVGPLSELAPAVDALRARVEVETILEVPAVRLKTVDGFKTASFPFTTDIPFLDRWGEPLLFGPGSMLEAHTADEFIEIDELHRAVDSYVDIARKLLQ